MTHDTVELPIRKLDAAASIPVSAYAGDAGIDLCSIEEVDLAPFERRLIGTGLAMAIPEGYAGFVLPRSGSAIKRGLSLVNAPGLIDSNYRGELKCIAINLDADQSIHIECGERIAQLVLMRVAEVSPVRVEALDATQRGVGGFGSSGTK